MKTKTKSIKPTNTKNAKAYRAALEGAIRTEKERLETQKRFPLWWDDGEKGKSVYIGEFDTMAEFFALCEDYLFASVNFVYVRCKWDGKIFKKDPPGSIHVRKDGIVIAGLTHSRDDVEYESCIPGRPTETEYPYCPISSYKIRSFRKTKIPIF